MCIRDRWDNGEKIELLGRLSKHKSSEIRLLSLEIAGRYEDTSQILSKLRNDSEPEVAKRAWIVSLRQYPDNQFHEIADEGLNSNFVNVRRAVIESAIDRGIEKIVLKGLGDPSPIVISKSIEALSSESLEIDKIREFLVHSSPLVRSSAYHRIYSENKLIIEDTKSII